MLKHITELYDMKLNGSDGDIGTIEDFYFDDQSWNVRYLVAETGTWLNDWQVLISPYSIEHLDVVNKAFRVNLTKKQIENSPPIERHQPVSRQFETEHYTYYGWPFYWGGGAILGLGGIPVTMPPGAVERQADEEQHLRDDPHLRSTLAVAGYEIEATDGPVGHITDFLVDDKTWAIQKIIVEAGHWYSGKEIRIAVSKVKSISFEDSKVYIDLAREDIRLTGENQTVQPHRHGSIA
jgi:uncharacterized protein YrrD